METHPSYTDLAHVLPKYPRAAGCLFQAYNDILLGEICSLTLPSSSGNDISLVFLADSPAVQEWSDVKVVDLEDVSRAAITGKKSKTVTTLHVVPCSLAETLSFGWLQTAFTLLSDPPEIYLAITSDDASIVYYKISRGIVKPEV
ncbi:tRNA intron endonuclease [Mycena latifolia]|nr:tRNA intron endonuclease [Mycena latifolia]